MRRTISCLLLVVVSLCLSPLSLQASEEGGNWRQRVSSESSGPAKDDIAAEIKFGREIAARMIGRFTLYDNPRLMKYVNLVGHALAQNTNRPELEFHFAVLNTNEINAYAAPGGYVFVTRGGDRENAG